MVPPYLRSGPTDSKGVLGGSAVRRSPLEEQGPPVMSNHPRGQREDIVEEGHAMVGATSGCVSEWASVCMCLDLCEETIDGRSRRAGEPIVAHIMV